MAIISSCKSSLPSDSVRQWTSPDWFCVGIFRETEWSGLELGSRMSSLHCLCADICDDCGKLSLQGHSTPVTAVTALWSFIRSRKPSYLPGQRVPAGICHKNLSSTGLWPCKSNTWLIKESFRSVNITAAYIYLGSIILAGIWSCWHKAWVSKAYTSDD